MTPTIFSELQRLILALAQFHRINAERDEGMHPHVYLHEVLAVRWGFPTDGPAGGLRRGYRGLGLAVTRADRY